MQLTSEIIWWAKTPFHWWEIHNRLPQTKGLKTTEICSIPILEVGSPKSRCPQGHAFSQYEKSFSWLFVASGGASNLWPSLVYRPINSSLWFHHHMAEYVCIQISLFLIRTPVIELEATLIWHDLILTDFICKDYFKISSHSQVPEITNLNITFFFFLGWGGHNSTHHTK